MPRNPYPIIGVNSAWALGNEEMGTKRKFWYHDPSHGTRWLFKYPQPNTGQHWAEKIAAEIAKLLDIPHASVELAVRGAARGSATESFVSYGHEMIHGNQLLEEVMPDYDPERTHHQSYHTIGNIWKVLEHFCGAKRAVGEAKARIAEYLVLDALIGNTDRHHENWGMLRDRDGKRWRHAVAPSFDHASSLGRELQPERRKRFLEEHRVGSYVEGGRGAIFWSAEAHRGPSPLQLVRYAAVSYPDSFLLALQKAGELDRNAVHEAVHRVPDEWMSPSSKEFAVELMVYSQDQLRRIGNE